MCGRTLIPAPIDASVVFHCKSGHELPLAELLHAPSAALETGLEVLLANWDREHQALISTLEDARKNGYLDVAEIFNRHAKSLENRIRKVRDVCSRSDTSKRILFPDAVHTICGISDTNLQA
ncbi:MAG TPA: hypothetical protein VNB29_04015 [Chthoniobacterales bacterium]|jgi:hypothetical protein|nr:hypothetical protein [Chthoniobacterales bacterium]